MWDLPSILARGFTDNLVDFMITKLGQLPEAARHVLKHLACLGRRASLDVLAPISGLTDGELHAALIDAVNAGLVIRIESGYEFPTTGYKRRALRSGTKRSASTPTSAQRGCFRVKNTRRDAMSCFSRSSTTTTVRVGRSKAKVSDSTWHSSTCWPPRAPKRPSPSNPQRSTWRAPSRSWGPMPGERSPPLAFAIALQQADCLYLTGELRDAVERLLALSLRAASRIDRATVTCLRAAVYLTLNQPADAIRVCLQQLREFGIEWESEPTDEVVAAEHAVLMARVTGSPEDLAALPAMRDPEWRAWHGRAFGDGTGRSVHAPRVARFGRDSNG